MTDKEILQAIRCCTSDSDCDRCKSECIFHKSPDPNDCIPEMGKAVADRLEALLTLNEALNERDEASKELVQALERKNAALERNVQLLKDQMPKWVSVEERLPETEPETVIWKDPDEGITSEVSALVLVVDRKGEMWVARYESGPIFQGWVRKSGRTVGGVTRWMPLPEPSSTEEVKQ